MQNKAFLRGLSSLLAFLFATALCLSAVANEHEGFVDEKLRKTDSTVNISFDTSFFKTSFTEDGIPSRARSPARTP